MRNFFAPSLEAQANSDSGTHPICMKVCLTGGCITFLIVVAQHCEAVRLPAESKNGDIDSVCHKVIGTSRYILRNFLRSNLLHQSFWGTRIAQFRPTCDETLRGLGPKVLEVATLSSNFSDIGRTTCYKPVTGALCSVQFEKVHNHFSLIWSCFVVSVCVVARMSNNFRVVFQYRQDVSKWEQPQHVIGQLSVFR